jgi:NAD(P)-dependent dehydrogenase (short-subunit alcohol dehydrogenase family)
MASHPVEPRVALVTGAASGIGLATAEMLYRDGWSLALCDANQAALDTLPQRFPEASRTLIALLDVTDEAAVGALVERIAARFGRLDGVVNSAGIADDVPALETRVDKFRRILDVNVIGSFIVARAAARCMNARNTPGPRGAIVNLASISGLRGNKGRVAYGASKGAVVTMTQVLANDLAEFGIRVNAVAPGPVETEMVRRMHTSADRALFKRYIPMARYALPDEIASAIVFLLDGTRAGYITGEILAVDGGFRGAGIIVDRA